MFRFLIHYLTAFLFVLVVACGDDNSASSEDDVLSSDSEVAGSSVSDYPESSNAEMGSSSNVDVPSSSSDAVPSSSSADVSSSSEETSSSSYVQRSHVIKDSSVYFEAENRLLDLRDSQEYRTVVIGEQTWMAQNLNYAYLELIYDLDDSSSWCDRNEPDSCSKYGRYYLFQAAVDAMGVFGDGGKGCYDFEQCESQELVKIQEPLRGVCPLGWHLPSKEEFEQLVQFVGGKGLAGKKLKSAEGWSEISGVDGTDDYGFAILPGGYIERVALPVDGYVDPPLTEVALHGATRYQTRFWTSYFELENGYDFPVAYSFEFSYDKDAVFYDIAVPLGGGIWGFGIKDDANSIRCLKDDD